MAESKVTEILVAFIALSGILIPFTYQNISTLIFDKPILNIKIDFNNNKSQEIYITNSGFSPISNISLFIHSHSPIKQVINQFSTEKVLINENNELKPLNVGTPKNKTTTFIEMSIPKIMNGEGSFVNLTTKSEKPLSLKEYIVYSTYDQGSSRGGIEESELSNIISFISFLIGSYHFWVPFYIIYMFIIIPYVSLQRRRIRFQRNISEIINNLISIKNLSKSDNNYYSSAVWYDIKTDKQEYIELRALLSVKDLMLIDNFYNKLDFRNLFIYEHEIKKLEYRNYEKDLENINKSCMKYAVEILLNINWIEYKETRLSYAFPFFNLIRNIKELFILQNYKNLLSDFRNFNNWNYSKKRKFLSYVILIIILIIMNLIIYFYRMSY